ncbi:hypothetical protein L9F63_028386 [Diploptera punctata]|uniref:Nudix hydrolase domain-containing protein n=1 Tax=Diploptera punctata TaxID=6984 RepID=A0AAD8EE05_DIPPU|nr:hypothetical protein L9F63_028386 [Diploptera punctata]
MDKINDIEIKPLGKSNFITPLRMQYTQNGVKKIWDLIRIHNSVCIIIFNTTRKVLVFVKQFRPAVYFAGIPDKDRQTTIDTVKYPPEQGITIELCAVSKLERIISYRSGIGVCGDNQTLFYAEVTDNMKVGKGGGNLEEGEYIETVEMTIPEAKKYLSKGVVLSPGGLLFGLLWFLQNKANTC